MSFPSSPSNNQTAVVNGITYVYNASKTVWTRQQTSISSAGLDDYARTTANTATNNIVILQGVDTTQNTRLSVVEGGLISANANTVYLNSLITTNNTRISVIEGGLISANANSAYLQGALNTANTNINTKFNSTGGTISGSVTISGNNDLIVTGNLIITGNISSQNVQQLTVADPLLVLGLGNYVSDTKDIGFASHYNDGSNAHTGLIRDSGTKEYHFFTGYTPEVDASNSIDINHASFASANVNASTFKGNLIATTAVVNGVNLLDVNTTQNTRISVIEGVNTTQNTNITYSTNLAQAAYNQANTGGLVSNTGIITVDTFTGDGSTVAFSLSVTPTTKNYTSITIDGATQLKSAYTLSGNIITLSEAPLTGENIEVISFTNGVITSYDTVARDIANTATNNITILQGVDTTQNTRISSVDNTAAAAYAKANAAFDKANTGVSTSTDDYARTAANTATNNIVILQGVNTTQNTNIAYATSLAQAAIDASANTGNYSIEYLVVAGGGGGGSTGAGNNGAGGGGAGGLLTDSVTLSSGETYVITVGSGGNGGASGAPNNGNPGANSSLIGTTTTVTAIGGGYGNASSDIGGPGGSGGGSKNGNAGGLGTAGQGNNGGVGSAAGACGGGGGGGAGAVGGNGSASVGGAGGVGLPSSITGSSLYYAGGGGGGTYSGNSPGAGGNGGGGAGAQDTSATSGTTNTGGGGGGTGGNSPGAGGNGGSGVVILRTIALADSTTGSPTITYDGAFNIYKFTSSGSIVFPSFAAEVVDVTARGDVSILQGVNTTQNTNITFATSLAQAAFDKANTGTSGGSSNVTIVTSDSFVGNGSNVAFTLSTTPSSKDYTIITFDGAVQLRSSYSLTANTITFTEAPLNGENVEVTSFSNMPATTTVTINTFTGDGSTVAYTLSVSPSSKDYTFVNFDGTAQLRSSYSLSGNILTFTEAPLVGENIEVTSFTTNSISSGTTIGKAIAMSIIFGG